MQHAFRFFDKNNNSLISYSEFQIAMESLRIKLSDDESKKVFEFLD